MHEKPYQTSKRDVGKAFLFTLKGGCVMNANVDISNTILETERLILSPWKQSDLNDFYEYASVDGVGQMAGWLPHQSLKESEKILNLFIDEKKTFALVYKGNGKTIGSLGLENSEKQELDDSLRAGYGREIGYVLSKDYWGMGLMPEAVKEGKLYLCKMVED